MVRAECSVGRDSDRSRAYIHTGTEARSAVEKVDYLKLKGRADVARCYPPKQRKHENLPTPAVFSAAAALGIARMVTPTDGCTSYGGPASASHRHIRSIMSARVTGAADFEYLAMLSRVSASHVAAPPPPFVGGSGPSPSNRILKQGAEFCCKSTYWPIMHPTHQHAGGLGTGTAADVVYSRGEHKRRCTHLKLPMPPFDDFSPPVGNRVISILLL